MVLPIALQEKGKYSDAFTQFIEALYEKFGHAEAMKLAKEIGKQAAEDILLKPYAQEIQAQAALIAY